MGSIQGTTVRDGPPTKGGLGKSDTARTNASFPTSPVIKEGNLCNEDGTSLKEYYQTNVLDASGGQGNSLFPGGVDMTYGGAPDIDAVTTGGSGDPAGPRVPSTASPGAGEGSNPKAIPEVAPVGGHDGDLGSDASPSQTSTASGHKLLTSPQITGKSPSAG